MFLILRNNKHGNRVMLLISGLVFLCGIQLAGLNPARANDVGVESRVLTLEDCVRIALDQNPLKRAAAEGFIVKGEKVGEAKAAYYPEVDVKIGYSRWQRHAFLPSALVPPGLSTEIGPTDDWTAYVSARITIFDGGRRRAMLQEARARQGMAENEVKKINQEITLEVHHTFFSHLAAMETLDVAKGNLERSRGHLGLVEKRRAAGDAVKAEVLRVQVEVADAGLGMVHAETLVEITRAGLNSAMGLPMESLIRVESRVGEVRPPDRLDMDAAFAKAMQSRPEIFVAEQQLNAAQSAIRGAKAAFMPRVEGEAVYGWQDEDFFPEDERWLAGVSIWVPIFKGFANTHILAGKKAEWRRLDAQTEKLFQDVKKELWSSHLRLLEAYRSFQATESLVQSADESLRAERQRYESGVGTLNDLLDAEHMMLRAEAAQVTARLDYYIAAADFNRSMGVLR